MSPCQSRRDCIEYEISSNNNYSVEDITNLLTKIYNAMYCDIAVETGEVGSPELSKQLTKKLYGKWHKEKLLGNHV